MAADPAFDEAASALIDRGVDGPIECALVLGTGLGSVVDDMQDAVRIAYADIPGFPRGEVSGHARQLCYGTLFGRKVLIYQGRAHYYEGGDAAVMRVPLGLLTAFGSPPLILTNAAGSLRPDMGPGGLALITDHINLNGQVLRFEELLPDAHDVKGTVYWQVLEPERADAVIEQADQLIRGGAIAALQQEPEAYNADRRDLSSRVKQIMNTALRERGMMVTRVEVEFA